MIVSMISKSNYKYRTKLDNITALGKFFRLNNKQIHVTVSPGYKIKRRMPIFINSV